MKPLAEVEKEYILHVCYLMGGNKTHAAKALGIGLRTLQRKLKIYACQDMPGESG